MYQHEIEDEYFEWLYGFIDNNRFHKKISYRKVIRYLFDTPFRWTIPKDENRASDGIGLRRRYAIELGFDDDYFKDYLDNPCSVLEVIIALALRIEETIMDDPTVGNRTSQWIWIMLGGLGLESMTDDRFNEDEVYDIIERFLDRDFEPDGKGSLFWIPNCRFDLRDTEIWIQMLWYRDTIT